MDFKLVKQLKEANIFTPVSDKEAKSRRKNPAFKATSVIISADWRDTEGLASSVTDELPKLGLYVYPDPLAEGSDTYSLVVSKKPLSQQQIEDVSGYTEIMGEEVSEANIFTPTSDEEVASREAGRTANIEQYADNFPILKDIHESNIFKSGRLTDQQWGRILKNLIKQNPEITYEELEKQENMLMGILMALDDATDNTIVKRH